MSDFQETKKLYHDDAYATSFEARVLDCQPGEEGYAVILDQTLFYPESGGQPADSGMLDMGKVLDVQEEGEVVIHTTDNALDIGAEVYGLVDWSRRFDHMQQHTGQHLLSQAFHQRCQAKTVGFHLGSEAVTIDLDQSGFDDQVLWEVESIANTQVFENREVTAFLAPSKEVESLGLRKPPVVEGELRIVDIADFERTACCGTHVRRTGEVGLVKILRQDHYKGGARITFVCGWRAVKAFHRKTGLIQDMVNLTHAGQDDLPEIVFGLQQQNKSLSQKVRRLTQEKLAGMAGPLLDKAAKIGNIRLVEKIFDASRPEEEIDAKSLRTLLNQLIGEPDTVALLGLAEERGHLFFGRSENVDVDLRPLFQAAMSEMEGKGGGSPSAVQGSGSRPEHLPRVIREAARQIQEQLS